ncbi:Theronine dehydrogenase-like Zn-dependent dehydrogenase [metagenome]|uniref:Theronine dehydrogenase-like Zn-dependent dehydrogenase n=1 Tax=metagenome TaxID=256318 RepID=A0A2P2C0E6_9ZZZZ
MKALEFASEQRPHIVEHPVPTPGPGEVLVAARRVGICHSDIELLHGRYIIPFSYPIIPGHEWAGEIAGVGSGVTSLSVGDRVVGECVIGDDHFGFSISGASAEYFIARPDWLHRLPDSMTWAEGALVETFTVGYYALMRAGNVNGSDLVVVLGAGPVGLTVTAAAAAMGATTLVVEPSEERRAVALQLGAAEAVTPEQCDEAVARLSADRGADVVVECSGHPEVMARSLELAAFKGRVAFLGIDVGKTAPAALGLIQAKELTITGSIGAPGVWPQALRLLASQKIDLSPLVTHVFGIEDGLDAINAASGQAGVIKAQIDMTAVVPAP